MLFTTTAMLAVMATTAAAAKTSRTFAVNYFYGKGSLTYGMMDPIVSPGRASGHAHMIMGGSNFSPTMSDTTLLQSTCTTSQAKADNSNYWVPSLFFQDPKDGSFTPVPLFYMKVYYFFEATDDTITAFQPGHRMVVGNAELRTPPTTGGASILDPAQGPVNPVQWICPRSDQSTPLYEPNSDGLHGVGIQDPGNGGAGVGFPDKNCDGYASPLRSDIHFPSCYNPAAGLDAYKTNMQFPSTAGSKSGNANCPPGWIHTPHLFFEVYWNTPIFADRWTQGQGKQPFVLSNGDSTGYSAHADFISGWEPAALQQIIDNCDTGNNGINQCPGLEGGVNDPSTSCNIPAAIPVSFDTSDITNTNLLLGIKIATLPGNNPVTGAGQAPPAPAAVPSSPASTAASGSAAAPTAPPAALPTGSASASSPPTAPKQADDGYGGGAPVAAVTPTGAPVATPAAGADSGYGADPAPVPSSGGASVKPSSTPSKPAADSGYGADPAPSSPSEAPPAAASGTPVATPKPAVASGSPAPMGTAPTNGVTDPAGWSFYGCYADKLSGARALAGITFANIGNHQVTTSKCIDYCEQRGFSMAGTEYGGQCFCGNSLVGSSILDDSKCNMPCEGDGKQTCGGSLALTVYSKSAAACRRKKRHLSSHVHGHSGARPLKV